MTDDLDMTEPNDIDFTAWEAPPMMNPQLADDVIAQLKRSVPQSNRRRRMWMAGGALAACAAAGVIAGLVITRGDGVDVGSGAQSVAATAPVGLAARVYRDFPGASYPQRVDLADAVAGAPASSSVDLEINAGFRAAREGNDIYVIDARGEANWQIGGQDRLHIQLGKAKGFGLLIEPSSGRVITKIRTNADEPVHVEVAGGDGVRIHAYRNGREWLLTSAHESLAIDPPADWRVLDEKTVAIDPFASCDDHRRSADDHLMRNELVGQLAELEAAYACDGRATDAAAIASGACAQHDGAKAQRYFELAATVDTNDVVESCHNAGIDLVVAHCSPTDVDALKAKATADLSTGQDAAALRGFEKAYACRADASLLPRIVLSACKSENAAKAKLYYEKCGAACSTLVARCQTVNIDLK